MRNLSPAAVPRGSLAIIGGAEDKLGRRVVLRQFVELAGGDHARVVVCATASSLGEEITALYDTVLRRLGAAEVIGVRPQTREQADDPALARAVAGATGVFLTGGNQLKLSSVVTGTAFGDALRVAYHRGAAIGGTSAGASVMSEHMVAFGTSGATPKNRTSQLARGLGLLPEAVVDQHFDQRNRYGRLLALVAQSPSLLGVGVDEDTAAVVTGGRELAVYGRGSVFVVDCGSAATNAAEAARFSPLLVSGAVVHTLPEGSRFDLRDRRLLSYDKAPGRGAAAALTAAVAETRLARIVAAEGADDPVVRRGARRQTRRPTDNDDVDDGKERP